MTILVKWNADTPEQELLRTEDKAAIKEELNTLGVRYEQWPTYDLPADADQETVLAAYKEEVDRITKEENFTLVDVMRLKDFGQPEYREQAKAGREKFLNEHTHDDDEVRFFVDGAGTFYLNIDNTVYAVLCERGDLLSVPEGSTHWFDMGVEAPEFTAIRFFHDGEGWVGDFTGSPISQKFPTHDEILAGREAA